MEELKQRFIELFSEKINRDGAKELLEWLQASDFFYAPASTRFHGSYESGLLEHSLHVYDCLVGELKALEMEDTYTEETVAISLKRLFMSETMLK